LIILSSGVLAWIAGTQVQKQSKPIPGLPSQARYDIQGEITVIGQELLPFRSKYAGANSLPSNGQLDATETGTVYLGARPLPNVEIYANPEVALGNAPGAGRGLAGYLNGDLIGQPTSSGYPYLARGFVRWRIPVRQGKDQPVGREVVGRAPNVIAGPVPQHRLIVTAGKFAATDIFDFNSYANNARTQFINNAFVNNLAYDYAEDSRGYDFGASAVLANPSYAVRFGTFAMPTTPGGDQLHYDLSGSHSEQLEVELNPQVLRTPKPPLTVRLLGYRNVGNMGRYADALAGSTAIPPPSLNGVRSYGTARAGLGINLEQGLADGGATGVFARLGWADGTVETDGFAEADNAFSLGAQISGARWKRKSDYVGLAGGWSGISSTHQEYLAAGGLGFNLGDGALNYGSESVTEAYYLYQATKAMQFTADVQYFGNPGYNRDRGPATAFSLRVRYAF
jgi:high affinity Mn2+ porin